MTHDQIRARILEKKKSMELKAQTSDMSPIIVPKAPKNHVTFFQMTVGTFIFLISLATILLYSEKLGDVEAVEVPVATAGDSNERLNTIESHLAVIDARLRKQHHYSWEAMLAINENAKMQKARDGQDYILFDEDGNLTRLPRTMKLTEDQTKQLELGVEAIK